MSTYNNTISSQTLAEAVAMDANVKAELWARYLEVGSRAHDVCSMFESEQPRVPVSNVGKRGIFCRRRELKAKIAQAEAQRTAQRTSNWDTGWRTTNVGSVNQTTFDPVEESFQRWETEQELAEMKRQMGQ